MSLSSFLHTVKWFQVWLYNSDNLKVIGLHTVCSIWPIERTLFGATTPGQRGSGSNGNEGVLHIPQISSYCFISYPGYSLGGVLPLCRDAVSVLGSLGKGKAPLNEGRQKNWLVCGEDLYIILFYHWAFNLIWSWRIVTSRQWIIVSLGWVYLTGGSWTVMWQFQEKNIFSSVFWAVKTSSLGHSTIQSAWISSFYCPSSSFFLFYFVTASHISCSLNSKVGDFSWGWLEGSLFNSYYSKV